MNINENRTARLKRYLVNDYKSGNKKAIYEIAGLFRKLNIPTSNPYKNDVLKPLVESGFISIVRGTYFIITIKMIREIRNGGDTHKKTDFSK